MDEVVTHDEVLRWLPASIRSDFTPPHPFAALAACGLSAADLDRRRAPTRAELTAGVAPPGYAVGGYIP
jgi:hypothetical protein